MIGFVVIVGAGVVLLLVGRCFVVAPSRPVLSWDERQVVEAEQRWARINAAKEAEAHTKGCRCGRPVTHVRHLPVMGGVPMKVWSCEEHVNVNAWSHDGQRWIPSDQHRYDAPEMLPWAGTVHRVATS